MAKESGRALKLNLAAINSKVNTETKRKMGKESTNGKVVTSIKATTATMNVTEMVK